MGFNIPGMGLLPLDVAFSPQGVQVNFPVKQFVKAAADNAISYAKARAQAALQQGLAIVAQQALASLGNPSFLVNRTPGLPGPTAVSVARNAPGGTLIERSLQPQPGDIPGNHSSPSPTLLPDEDVPAADNTFTYASDSRKMAQDMQQAAAELNDQLMDELNNWNDVSTYGVNAGDAMSQGLQKSAGPITDDALSSWFVSEGGNDDSKGYFEYRGSDSALPSDDDAYVPLVFTDLRPSKSTYRAVYFRPFIKSFNESITPNWNKTNYFGRVDPVATYKSTDRVINLTFTVTCFSSQDLAINMRKLAWLSSMCYPEYAGDSYKAGPVTRMRIGDMSSAVDSRTGKGLSGIITSLSLNYDQSIWELDTDSKLPRMIEVTVGFQVIHDRAIGLVTSANGPQFGGINGGSADIRKFRAAFGTVDYLNETAGAPVPGLASLEPKLIPMEATAINDFNPPEPNIPQIDVQQAQGWAGLDVDSSLGTLV